MGKTKQIEHVKIQTKGNAQCLFVSYFMKERKIIFQKFLIFILMFLNIQKSN